VQTEALTALEVLVAVPVGLMAVALLVVNNLRDIPGDTAAGKRTLAVRIGPPATRRLYEACVLVAVVLVVPIALIRPWALLGLAALPLALVPVRAVASGADGPALIPVLGATGRAQLALGVLLAVGLGL
jgi:1,4-dihydroxy-2-naphthoate octaprenyltransferase